jgi:hypothetical protein
MYRLPFLVNDRLNGQTPGTANGSNGSIAEPDDWISNLNSSKIMRGFLIAVSYIGSFVGIGLTIVGVITFLLALKDHDGDSKSKAINYIIAGVAFFSLGIILGIVFDVPLPEL